MSNEDLQFHYFKVHDSDNDDKLDGIELATAMAHYHDEENGEKPEDYTEEVRKDIKYLLDTRINHWQKIYRSHHQNMQPN